ncbi:MAG: B12-binding domain-containing protein [Acidimicrobiia bacterium]|nr:B12-binding domain-containing protein [Acidimicrobiia bacterium]
MTTDDEQNELTLQEVADELGLHYMTVYRYVRLGMLDASKRGRSWVVTRDDFDAFTAASAEPTERGTAEWDQRLLNRMVAADDAGAWQVVESALTSGMTVSDVYTKMVTPALTAVGEQWRDGKIGIAEEHAASQIAYRIVARLGPRAARRGVKRGTILLGSTATELHSLPLSIAADLLRLEGFEVIDLGANLPPESFAQRAAVTNALIAVAIGVTAPDQDDEIRNTVAALRDATDSPILVGGRGVGNLTADDLGVDAVAASAEDAVGIIERLLSEE